MSNERKTIGNGISLGEARERGLRWGVILIPTLIFAIIVIIGFINSEVFIGFLWEIFEKIMVNFGWLISLGCLSFVAFMIITIVTPIGNIRFGGKDAKPEYSTWNWWAISLCAGIGTGIVLWGPVEPLMLAMAPVKSLGAEPGTINAAIWAMVKSFLHWTFTPYAIYVTVAIPTAYAVYNMKKKYNVSSGFTPLLGKTAEKTSFSAIVDTLTVFAITGGVAGSLGYGIMQISSGIGGLANIPVTPIMWVLVAAAIIIAYNISSITGLDKGIKWLSDKNAWLFILLLIFVFLFGPKAFTLNLGTESFGKFINSFIETSTFTNPFSDTDTATLVGNSWPQNSELWPQWWDMYWFTDWLSFGPIVGLFCIKMAKGRTIREFVIVNWLLPALFGVIWFTIFGGAALDIQFNPQKYVNMDLMGYATLNDYMGAFGYESVMLKVLEAFPLFSLTKPIMLIIVSLSFVTLADSMTSTVSLMTIKRNEDVKEAPSIIKLSWGLLMGCTSIVFVLNGGLDGIKVVKTIAGFPILFVEIAIMLCFLIYIVKHARSGKFEKEIKGGLPEDIEKEVGGITQIQENKSANL